MFRLLLKSVRAEAVKIDIQEAIVQNYENYNGLKNAGYEINVIENLNKTVNVSRTIREGHLINILLHMN